ncbi:uncharacterized protein B0H64DRAFT_21271 [Chaetomium fimeti]|uniref:Uncharacterized protein n=1 Tax=Chaetomium fimeti TaxID=1854472 RepID=A0AAE0LX16_9PEZI|nr:hypothetical protein B0H64DRAFT_21271 [Chaetomium fimeti]
MIDTAILKAISTPLLPLLSAEDLQSTLLVLCCLAEPHRQTHIQSYTSIAEDTRNLNPGTKHGQTHQLNQRQCAASIISSVEIHLRHLVCTRKVVATDAKNSSRSTCRAHSIDQRKRSSFVNIDT